MAALGCPAERSSVALPELLRLWAEQGCRICGKPGTQASSAPTRVGTPAPKWGDEFPVFAGERAGPPGQLPQRLPLLLPQQQRGVRSAGTPPSCSGRHRAGPRGLVAPRFPAAGTPRKSAAPAESSPAARAPESRTIEACAKAPLRTAFRLDCSAALLAAVLRARCRAVPGKNHLSQPEKLRSWVRFSEAAILSQCLAVMPIECCGDRAIPPAHCFQTDPLPGFPQLREVVAA
jgi:hypothetical protein